MTIKSQGGQSLGTKILDSQGKEMDLQISSIDISFRVDEPVTANVDLLKIPTEIAILFGVWGNLILQTTWFYKDTHQHKHRNDDD